MPYRELLERLVSARRFGVKLGLERMRALLAALGHPEQRLGVVIHVAGTNGKGSVVAMIAAMVRAAGLRVATYTSPHLSTLRERIVIDRTMATEAAIVEAAARVSAAGGDELTFFEQITAIAMVIIADAQVDVTVLEVGLGGRLDATNVVAAPVAVVTGVAMDHEAILGDTLAAIAAEKAGIWKPGQRAIIGRSGEPEAVATLVELARAAGVASVEVVDDTGVPVVALAGAHQRRNAAAAIAAVRAAGLPVITDALAHVVHPGRFERVKDLILDGAHNPHGARALAETLRSLALRPALVLAISADKNARAIVGELANDVSAIIATRYAQDRAMDVETLAAVCREVAHVPVSSAPDLQHAVAIARSINTAPPFGGAAPPGTAGLVLDSTIVIAGSLFIVGEARVAFLGAPADPVRVSDPPATTT
jgi:dihydrofolate synthase/folylpolyglutamate synthase